MSKESLSSFIASIPHASYAPSVIVNLAKSRGATQVDFASHWQLESNKSYVSTFKNAVILFRPGQKSRAYKACGAHIDSPCLHIKHESLEFTKNLLTFNTEPYGSALLSTWLDRPLEIVGEVITQNSSLLIPRGLLSGHIPNLAIHLNRDFNKGFEYNPQVHLKVIFNGNDEIKNKSQFLAFIAKSMNLDLNDIIDFDLYLSAPTITRPSLSSLIHAPRLDNLSGTHAIFEGFFAASSSQSTRLAFFFDHEEIGSTSSSGASSSLFMNCLERIYASLGNARVEFLNIGPQSSFLSVDAAHGVHPAYSEKHDVDYAPFLGEGLVLKSNINHRYASSSQFKAQMKMKWLAKGIKLQEFTNRADMACGSTIGPFIESLGLQNTIDLGIPLLSMHSACETADIRDQASLIDALTCYYED